MVESIHGSIYAFSKTDNKAIERIIDNDNVVINHMVLPEGEAMPEHSANSNVYMIVVRGELTLELEGQEELVYGAGTIVAIPYLTKMHPLNKGSEVLEFFVVKAPGPRIMQSIERGGCNCKCSG